MLNDTMEENNVQIEEQKICEKANPRFVLTWKTPILDFLTWTDCFKVKTKWIARGIIYVFVQDFKSIGSV